MRRMIGLTALVAMLSACEDASGPETTQFSVAYNTTFSFDPQNRSVVIVNGNGTATGLGATSTKVHLVQTLDLTVQPNTLTGTTMHLISGTDTLKGHYNGTSNPPLPAPSVSFSGPFTITSGTGRFAGATGEGTFTGSANLTNATGQVTFVGSFTR